MMNMLDSSVCPSHSVLEQAVHVSHLHKHSLQLGVVLNGHLAVLSADPWRTSAALIPESRGVETLRTLPDVLKPPNGTSTGVTL